jgi:hypothetical protein
VTAHPGAQRGEGEAPGARPSRRCAGSPRRRPCGPESAHPPHTPHAPGGARRPLAPPGLRTSPPPWSSGRRPCGRPRATKARYARRARCACRANRARTAAVACPGRATTPRSTLGPLQA